jgi:hypothetical protein
MSNKMSFVTPSNTNWVNASFTAKQGLFCPFQNHSNSFGNQTDRMMGKQNSLEIAHMVFGVASVMFAAIVFDELEVGVAIGGLAAIRAIKEAVEEAPIPAAIMLISGLAWAATATLAPLPIAIAAAPGVT